MSAIEYHSLTDEEKLDLLRLLYQGVKDKPDRKEDKETIIAETQIVYNRIKLRSH
jgi:hypothetical protein